MSAAELLIELKARGVSLEADGGRLRVDAPKGAIPQNCAGLWLLTMLNCSAFFSDQVSFTMRLLISQC
jgi:hypothetical protein